MTGGAVGLASPFSHGGRDYGLSGLWGYRVCLAQSRNVGLGGEWVLDICGEVFSLSVAADPVAADEAAPGNSQGRARKFGH